MPAASISLPLMTPPAGSSSNAHAWPLRGLRRSARPAQVPPPHWGIDREPLPGVLASHASHAPPSHAIRPLASLLHAHRVPPRPVPQLQLVRPLARSPQRRGCHPPPPPSPILTLLQPRRHPFHECRKEASAGRRAVPRGPRSRRAHWRCPLWRCAEPLAVPGRQPYPLAVPGRPCPLAVPRP